MAINDTLIIGGGVIGLSTARELVRSGVPRIAIVERGRPGREASFAAGGMLAPNAENEVVDDFYRLCEESRLLFPQLSDDLRADTGIDIELDRTGTLYTSFTEADSGHVDTRYRRQQDAGIPVQRLSAAETLAAEPYIAPNVRESLFFPNDWQVENRRLLAALEKEVRAGGIRIIEGCTVQSLTLDKGRITGAATSDGHISAGTTVLATGAWTSLIKTASGDLPFTVRPIKGQMICMAPSGRRFRHVIYSPRGYLVPRADGRILVGATAEDVGFDTAVTDEGVDALRIRGSEIAPFLAGIEPSEKWAGLRPFAGSGRPIIGPVADREGLFIATAHYRNGILLAPITAKIIAAAIATGSGSEYFGHFGPGPVMQADKYD